jgi:hypothetical protein
MPAHDPRGRRYHPCEKARASGDQSAFTNAYDEGCRTGRLSGRNGGFLIKKVLSELLQLQQSGLSR